MSDEKNKPQVSFEDALLHELRFGGIDKENLSELVRIVAGLQKAGLKRLKAFPKGIPPVVDALRVTGIADASNVNQILGTILTQTPRLSAVSLFPYGIPWPEIFRVGVEIGAPVESGEIRQF